MAMRLGAAVANTATQAFLQSNMALASQASAACPAWSSRTSVAFSGFDTATLKASSTAGRTGFSSSTRLFVKAAMEVDIAKTSVGGVLLPSADVKHDRFLQGDIIAAGSEVIDVSKGQKVMFADINAYEVNLGTLDRLCLCRSGDLLAVLQ